MDVRLGYVVQAGPLFYNHLGWHNPTEFYDLYVQTMSCVYWDTRTRRIGLAIHILHDYILKQVQPERFLVEEEKTNQQMVILSNAYLHNNRPGVE